MTNDIVDALSVKLRELFPDVKIYSENIEQGFTAPCFYISVILHTKTPYIGKRAKHTYTFGLQYFPKHGNSELGEAEDILADLGDIRLANGNLLHTTCGDIERVDGALICPCAVSVVMIEMPGGEKMSGEAGIESKVRE
ncbi:MAG: hypothetical protein KH334_00305 [Clostridiales bacterium]|nr:hypothetical protein [Clostridiales bacterium]